MPNKRAIKLDQYGISKHRYNELKEFCMQYTEWRDELKYKTDTVKSKRITDMPQPTSGEDATAALAVRRLELEDKCKIVEQTAIEASGDMYQYIIKSVTEDVPCWYLEDIMGMPYCRSDFYACRRYFFFLLDKNKR